mmetsp:Transcript_46123/g.76238  ORF Transcript_46123/g.76238 Transcript_46123/m.76238 type:complete len:320 (+) Transcript_46123:74-1033(+)|eukprot:CAMPEP_0119332132 /NCGR_PEP_ID=MMETSP1333-20130426/82108_1 /TAXON_ID=418940 /ORGANISM="Scyphosphaera apsteinii, Strain RCC1455" /LENGTH=319 /DNA_ID=CAMNT_0007341897 /DNA_START=66 /DNA_END=1025 /DNA_ORIENTATION=+
MADVHLDSLCCACTAAAEPFETFLYFWDERDGPGWQGWWITPGWVGNERFFAFANDDVESPDLCKNWQGSNHSIHMHVARLSECLMGVRAASLNFEGAYMHELALPHDHKGCPVFRRLRDLTEAEKDAIDQRKQEATDIVTFSLANTSFSDAPSTVEGLVDTVPGVQPVLDWVNGGDVPDVALMMGATLDWVRGSEAAIAARCLSVEDAPRLVLHINSADDLDLLVTKDQAERVSVPELHDDESPLPVGWVIAARSNEVVTRTVRDHVLTAAKHLEEELPEEIRTLPQVLEQIQRLQWLVQKPCFTVCVWSDVSGSPMR